MSTVNNTLNNTAGQSNDLTEIVFEGKNKAFGAYELRKNYNKRISLSLLIGVSTILLIVFLPAIINALTPEQEEYTETIINYETTVLEAPPEDPNEPPPPPPPTQTEAPPPMQASTEFIAPEVTNERVEEVPTTEDLAVSNPGSTTQEGSFDGVPEGLETGTGNAAGVVQEEIFTYVEEMPAFPGGEAKLRDFLSKNLKYPEQAKRFGMSGRVVVEFIVGKDGKIKDQRIVRGLGYGLDDEALRVTKLMPDWTPGKVGGKAVIVKFQLPILFTLN